MSFTITGKMSTFGGPADMGVSPSEGLALIEPADLDQLWFRGLFLEKQPAGTTGLARRLNPNVYYIAMRWAYDDDSVGVEGRLGVATSRAELRKNFVTVMCGGRTFRARPVDWGPHVRTGRIADLSPGLAKACRVVTDDEITVLIPWAE